MVGRFHLGLVGSISFLFFMIAGFAGVSRAQPVPDGPSVRERTLLAERFTAEKLWYWQKRLGLEDWNVCVVVASLSDNG